MKRLVFTILVVAAICSIAQAKYSGGTGDANDPYQIADANDLLALAATTADYSKCFILTADVNLQGQVFTTAIIAPDTNDDEWDFQGTPFTGIFDGNGHVISYLTITASAKNYIGLFGYVSGGQIRNLGIENANIEGYYDVGGLVGYNESGSIIICYATGSVSGWDYVGGLAGYNESGSITSCYATGSVSNNYDVGGLVGYNYYGSLTSCYATGSVSGDSYVGGLMGYNESGSITSCYATGSVNGDFYVGGLMGYNYCGLLTSCYATGSVSGDSYVGGLTGYKDQGTLTGCFWDTETSGTGDGMGNKNTVSYYVTQAGTLFEDFETLTGWTITLGSGVIDHTYTKTGAGSLKITTNAGSYTTADKTISVVGTDIPGGLGFWFYIVDSTKVSRIVVYISSQTNFSKYFAAYSNIPLHNGWNFLTIARDSWSNVGGESWNNTMVRLRITTRSLPGQVAIVYYDSLYYGIYTKPKCIISFDDGYNDTYNTAYPIMNNSGFKGTCFIISSWVGAAGEMTLANLATLYGAGWDISNHTKTHPDLTALTEAQQETEIKNCADYLYANGFTRNEMYKLLAYPMGRYNATTAQADIAQGVILARGTTSADNLNINEFGSRYLLNAKTLANTDTLAVAEGYIDSAITNGDTLILYFHHIVDTPAADIEWSTANFQALINYIKTKESQIDVVTLSDWYAGLTVPDPAGAMGKNTVDMKTLSTFTSAGWDFNDVWAICEGTNYPRLLWSIPAADLVCPDGVNFADYSFFAERWMNTNCASNDNCDDADFDFSGTVDAVDLKIFCNYWLQGQ